MKKKHENGEERKGEGEEVQLQLEEGETQPLNQLVDLSEAFTTNQEDLIEWAKRVGKEQGYIVIIKAAQSIGRRRPYVRLQCECSGKYIRKVGELQRASTGTKKCECPFRLIGEQLTKDSWALKVTCGFHNHLSAKQLQGHSYAGRLSTKEMEMLADMTSNLIKPKEILRTLKNKDEFNVINIKTIYNARQRYKLVERASRSQMQELMKQLEDHKYVSWHIRDELADVVKSLFWAHPTSIHMLNTFPSVLIMDATYKTNRSQMPLLEIVGMTSTNLTFSVAFVYMDEERKDSYIWALEKLKGLMSYDNLPGVIVTDRDLELMNAIETVFPTAINLLCIWHISKNVIANCKKMFQQKTMWDSFYSTWNTLVCSSSEDSYKERLSSFEDEFCTYPLALDYVKNTWLNPHKERFVAAWTDKVLHMGNVTTNRAENAHAKLKRYFRTSLGNFLKSWKIVHSLIEGQHKEIKETFEKSVLVAEHDLNRPIFTELRGLVSQFAMQLILAEIKRVEQVGLDKKLCRCINRTSYGLPCAHELAEMMRIDRPILLADVHPHWRKLHVKEEGEQNDGVCSQLNLDMEFAGILSRFNESTETEKLALKKQLREIAFPSATTFCPPIEKVKTKGHQVSKAERSTRRKRSHFEIFDSINESNSTPPTVRSAKMLSKKHLLFSSSFPKQIHKFIETTIDVKSDGNCGFRCVATLLGRGEDDWAQVRRELKDELTSFEEEYIKLYGSIDEFAKILHALTCFESPIMDPERWMILPEMGHLIASCYDVVLVYLSLNQCLTFFPLRSVAPADADDRHVICIGFVADCHFIQVYLREKGPIPPPALKWREHRYECSRGWELPYLQRIKTFRELLGLSSGVTSTDTIESD